jgi:hypothetical protein
MKFERFLAEAQAAGWYRINQVLEAVADARRV